MTALMPTRHTQNVDRKLAAIRQAGEMLDAVKDGRIRLTDGQKRALVTASPGMGAVIVARGHMAALRSLARLGIVTQITKPGPNRPGMATLTRVGIDVRSWLLDTHTITVEAKP